MNNTATAQQDQPVERKFVKMNDATKMFAVSRTCLYNMSKRGEIRIYKFGGASLLKVSEIEELIESRVLQWDEPGGPAGGLEN